MSTSPMIFRGVDEFTNDWNFGQGLGSYVTAEAAIVLNVQTALKTFYGDAFWDGTFGVDWISLLGTPNSLNAILAQTRAVIAGCQGVTGITSVTSNLNRVTRSLYLQYNISTVYSLNVPGQAQIQV